MKKTLSAALALILMIALLPGTLLAEENPALNYQVLINKKHPLPDGWEDAMETVTFTNSREKEVTVERAAYEAFLQLKDALARENVMIDIDSAYLSVAEQQEKVNRLAEDANNSLALQYATAPGYSEYHTGLAMNLYLIVDGKNIYKPKDMVRYLNLWDVVHARLAEFGFILRYPYDKTDVTGCDYEPWYIRYVGLDAAKNMKEKNLALEEYAANPKQ